MKMAPLFTAALSCVKAGSAIRTLASATTGTGFQSRSATSAQKARTHSEPGTSPSCPVAVRATAAQPVSATAMNGSDQARRARGKDQGR